MSFTGNEDHSITLSEASDWTANYRSSAGTNPLLSHFFGKAAIEAILHQDNCVGMRIYYAVDSSGNKQLIIVGVTADENDLYNGLLAEKSFRCPPLCPSSNPLNS